MAVKIRVKEYRRERATLILPVSRVLITYGHTRIVCGINGHVCCGIARQTQDPRTPRTFSMK